MKRETILAQAGSRWDEHTGAVSMPIYQSATFRHPALGESTGFDYTRSGNPTRKVLEETLAQLDEGVAAHAFSSGLAAVDALLHVLQPGDRLLATRDLYGGTVRLLDRIHAQRGISIQYVDTTNLAAVRAALPGARAVFVETPSNPLLGITDLKGVAALAREAGAWLFVDNTFLTPLLQRPLELGADAVVYSATKFLSGHNDVLAGVVVSGSRELADRIGYHQNAAGAVLGAFDSWLLLRGLKTLALRLERQQATALRLAQWLQAHPRVRKVHYPGLPDHPGHVVQRLQADGFGAMISFEVVEAYLVPVLLRSVRTWIFAESLGGTESLVTFPAVQTHADIPPEVREELGINDRLLRLSVGLEDFDDLTRDLDRALVHPELSLSDVWAWVI